MRVDRHLCMRSARGTWAAQSILNLLVSSPMVPLGPWGVDRARAGRERGARDGSYAGVWSSSIGCGRRHGGICLSISGLRRSRLQWEVDDAHQFNEPAKGVDGFTQNWLQEAVWREAVGQRLRHNDRQSSAAPPPLHLILQPITDAADCHRSKKM